MGLWFFPAWGFLLWLLATIVIRVTGQHLFDPDQPVIVALVFFGTVPLIAAVTIPIYDWRRVNLQDRPTAAILMALPGLLIDILVLLLFSRVYPNLGDTGNLFGAWLLWAYGLVLISGLLPYNRLWKV
jgi:hypothetical protein